MENITRRNMPTVKRTCLTCKKEYLIYEYRLRDKKNKRGRYCSAKCRGKLFKKTHLAEGNPMWKGEDVGYGQLHIWVRSRLKTPERCEKCRKIKKLDLANRSGKYLRQLDDWEWLCRKCHMESDGRLNRFREVARDKTRTDRKGINNWKWNPKLHGKEQYARSN